MSLSKDEYVSLLSSNHRHTLRTAYVHHLQCLRAAMGDYSSDERYAHYPHAEPPCDSLVRRERESELTIQQSILHLVAIERERQDKKWGEQNHNDFIWLTILTEEVGELAADMFDKFHYERTGAPRFVGGIQKNRVREAIEVAAVAIAYIECLIRRGEAEIEELT